MTIKEIIFRLSKIRTQANLSARALSLMIGKNATYITKMEAGEFTPNISTLFDILSVCNCPPEKFFAQNFDTFNQDKELSTLISDLPDKQKRTLIEFLNAI